MLASAADYMWHDDRRQQDPEVTRLVRPHELPVGARVGRPVLSGHVAGAPLLRAGVVVTESIRNALERSGVTGVYLDDEPTAGIEPTPALDERTRLEVTNSLAATFTDVPTALAGGRLLRREAVDDLDSTVDAIIDDILDLEPETLTLSSLASADAYTLEHSIDVTILGLLVANRLFREHGPIDWAGQRTHSGITEALRRFGMGLLLHDVGELGLPAEISRKAGPSTTPSVKLPASTRRSSSACSMRRRSARTRWPSCAGITRSSTAVATPTACAGRRFRSSRGSWPWPWPWPTHTRS